GHPDAPLLQGRGDQGHHGRRAAQGRAGPPHQRSRLTRGLACGLFEPAGPGSPRSIRLMSRTIVARWKDWSGEGLEHLVLQERADGITVESVVLTPLEDAAVAARYRIVCDPGWRVLRLEAGLDGESPRVELSS